MVYSGPRSGGFAIRQPRVSAFAMRNHPSYEYAPVKKTGGQWNADRQFYCDALLNQFVFTKRTE